MLKSMASSTSVEDFHCFSFSSPVHETQGHKRHKANKNIHFVHPVGSTCSKGLKI